ncbi:putative phage abortive infection protein [Bacillus subtilis]
MKRIKKSELFTKESWVMWAGIIVCIVAIITPFLLLFYVKETYLESFKDIGAFGDFFGGTTVGLFNLSSILLVLAAVIIQRKELKDTRTQFKKQQIDNTFFNMINLNNEIVRSLKINEDVYGKEVLKKINTEIVEEVSKDVELDVLKPNTKQTGMSLRENYKIAYLKYENILGHYFRNLYRIVKFIDQSELTDEEKKNYIGILRAQLSTDELSLIFYNALSPTGRKFKKLIIEYDFFDEMLTTDPIYKRLKINLREKNNK